jgi:hypothetical protein
VWARGRVATEECPRSYVSAQSLEWLEKYFLWRRLGALYPEPVSVKDLEAFTALDQEIATERGDG